MSEFRADAVQRWHVSVQESYHFARDETSVWIAGRTRDGIFALKPVVLEWESVGEGVARRDDETPSLVIPNELGRRLLEQLVTRYLATDAGNLVTRIRELEHQRDTAQRSLDNLIAGIGRIGGVK